MSPKALRQGATAEFHLHAGTVVTGRRGVVLHDALVTIRAGRIASVGPAPSLLPPRTTHHRALLPGLVDAHVHLAFAAGSHFEVFNAAAQDEAAARAVSTLEQLLRRGVTAVRDLGCPETVLKSLRIELRHAPSRFPRLVCSGPPITVPNGHLSTFGIPVASPLEARRAVGRCLSAGADVIKAVVTGGRLTPGTRMGCLALGGKLLDAVVDEAHASGTAVAAHVHGTEGVKDAVRAGVDTLEHCSWTDRSGRVRRPVSRLLEEMRVGGQVIVTAGPLPPSLRALVCEESPLTDPPEDRRARRQLRLWRNARLALLRGVPVAIGTDSLFGAVPGYLDLAARARLMNAFAEWRLSELVESMTTIPARACTGDESAGLIAPGVVADVVALAGDPLVDPGALARVELVLRAGELVPLAVPRTTAEVPASLVTRSRGSRRPPAGGASEIGDAHPSEIAACRVSGDGRRHGVSAVRASGA